jgi:hypothetical protein
MSQARRAARVEERGAAYYRRLLQEQEASGSSLRAFALERGLSPWTLYGWRSRLKRSVTAGSPPADDERFVAVDVIAGAESASGIEVVLSDGVVVRLPREVGLERLVEFVRALRSC